jgi:SpoVK/Ycf46/Vps4 family AAA+-type ATPase
VVVILEEVEGIARRRGGQDAAVYDRILATLLQRLDDPTDDLAQLPLVLISTSNRPDLIDSAMCRRLGLQARFTRLDRAGLAAVLDKKLKSNYPYPPLAGSTPREVRARLLADVVEALFGSGEDAHALIEVTLRGGRKLVKRRRDFLTGGLVEQAVATAIDRTVADAAECAEGAVGLTAEAVREALRQHIDALADNLTADNAADYLDLPENARVAAVRRLRPGGSGLPYLLSDLDN